MLFDKCATMINFLLTLTCSVSLKIAGVIDQGGVAVSQSAVVIDLIEDFLS